MAKSKAKKGTRKSSPPHLAENFRQVISHAEELLHATAGELGERAQEIRGQLASKLEAAKDKLHNLDDVKEVAEEGIKEADRVIRRHPYESVGVALVAGLVIGALISRR